MRIEVENEVEGTNNGEQNAASDSYQKLGASSQQLSRLEARNSIIEEK